MAVTFRVWYFELTPCSSVGEETANTERTVVQRILRVALYLLITLKPLSFNCTYM
jgi:hypothetical protein